MRPLTVNTFLTLDGVMQAPGAPEEDRSGGFALGGWSVNHWDDRMGQLMEEQSSAPFDLLLGRKTYEIFAAHWPYASGDPMADKLNAATKYVASTTLERPSWANTTVLRHDVAQEVARLKQEDGPELQVHGSATLIQTLLAHELVDLFRLWVFPVVVGPGKRLFADGTLPRTLRLVSAETSTTGVVVATYERGGEIEIGSFALEEPTEAELERRRRADTAS